jgi:methylmalonyl-CoA mutase N-terminal domain/subunit
VSGEPVEPLYTPLDRPDPSPDEARYYNERIGLPGEFPFTRGPYGTMYRTRLWTMRQFAGFGTAEETNERYHFLLGRGQTGLSVAFDFPTLMGYDSDHDRSLGEVGKCGVAISSLDDMETLFAGIPLDKVSVSMTINGPAIILFCFYIVAAEKQGISADALRGTVQNDILKEYQAQHAWVYPPEPALRLVIDMFEWASKNAPSTTRSPSAATTSARRAPPRRRSWRTRCATASSTWSGGSRGDGRGRLRAAPLLLLGRPQRLLRGDRQVPRRPPHLGAPPARPVRLENPESWRLRTHAQTAGVTLTAQQPENNIVRVAYQAMAAVLGGTQSLHTNSMDETLALPTEKAVQIALRTQQVLAYETGVANTVDPLAGSYYLEALTDQMEAQAEAIFAEIDGMGGVVPGIERGYFQQQIARSAMRQQIEIERNERTIVGVNDFTIEGEKIDIPLLKVGEEAERRQRERMAAMRARRDQAEVDRTLAVLQQVARDGGNVVPPMLDAARAYATLYEIRHAMEAVFGAYQEPVFF